MPTFSKPLVFINYRRADARAEAGRLAGDLERAFGEGFVFQDVEDIRGGDKWIDALIDAGNQSKVILAVMGPEWLQLDAQGHSRLSDPQDWVRKELESAIQNAKTIIPITVNDGILPTPADLPDELKPLLHHQAFDIRTDRWKHDVQLLVKQIAKQTEAKPISQDRLKKLLKLARIIGFLMVPLLLGVFMFTQMDEEPGESIVGQAPLQSDLPHDTIIDDKPLPITANPGRIEVDKKQKFCPEFNQAADLKTLLFPFSSADGGDYSVEHFIQRKISKTCTKFGIGVDIGKANIPDNEYYDLQRATNSCDKCIPDILLTGLAFKDQAGNFGVQADFGFCDPQLAGYLLNEDLMEIDVASVPISSLSSNPNIQASVDHVIQIYLGIYLAKNGNFEKSNTILKQTVENKDVDNGLKKEAYKILWQNGYQLNDKKQCIESLEKMYELDQNNLKAIATKSVILYDESNYSEAIKGLDVLVSKTPTQAKREKYIIKRADAKYESKQYTKAKEDYLKVNQSTAVRTKIKNTNRKIEANNIQIGNLQADLNSLSPTQRLNLADLYLQNGKTKQSLDIIQEIDVSNINTEVIKINPELLKVIQTKASNRRIN